MNAFEVETEKQIVTVYDGKLHFPRKSLRRAPVLEPAHPSFKKRIWTRKLCNGAPHKIKLTRQAEEKQYANAHRRTYNYRRGGYITHYTAYSYTVLVTGAHGKHLFKASGENWQAVVSSAKNFSYDVEEAISEQIHSV